MGGLLDLHIVALAGVVEPGEADREGDAQADG